MKKLILLIFLSISLPIFSQVEDEMSSQVYLQMEEVAQEVLSQAFAPPSQLKRDDWNLTFTPGYFRIQELELPRDVTEKQIEGITLGLGGAYGISSRLMAYGSYAGSFLRGEASGPWVPGQDMDAQLEFNYQGLFAGMGYFVMKEDKLDIPIFLGFQAQHYSLLTTMDESSGTTLGKLEGQGFLFGASGGAAVNLYFSMFRLSPYFLYMLNFNGAAIHASLDSSLPLVSGSADYALDPYSGATIGLDFGLSSDSHWSFGASLLNLLPWIRTSFDQDEFTSLVCYVRYSS